MTAAGVMDSASDHLEALSKSHDSWGGSCSPVKWHLDARSFLECKISRTVSWVS